MGPPVIFFKGGGGGEVWVPTTGKRNEAKIEETLGNKKVTITKKKKGEFPPPKPKETK